ncbi:MAG: FecR domain-containing protein [Bacteroidetes bacterium]|nr:FecR domain-containing protein [Bacteroidota bacterium]MBU1372114.1 FecR domain-containing protein [Bacteroidota bacterium]MBU1484035.1 FecR domain-containing protein [Bacteroidota bacterium]MBU1760901.1 FecR domain-containing protein [Bacteroidota bacterium]MBU2045674.1 FecR domain-containing protein [Bacteroidota bacterium]
MNNKKGNKDFEEELNLKDDAIEAADFKEQIKMTKQAIDAKINAYEKDQVFKSLRQHRFKNLMKMAAAILLVGSIAFWFTTQSSFLKKKAIKYTTISSQQKERKKIILPDGSVVWLNASSQLSYDENFNDEQRAVNLEGEAYFEVHHDANKTFIVKVGDLKTQVLGTKFNIQAYRTHQSVDVSLLSGKIAVSVGENQAVMLAPHQSISLDKQTRTLGAIKQEETASAAAWHEGKIIFKDQSFESILLVLERNFGLHIVLKSKELNAIKINGNFSLDENPTTIVEELCRLIDARYKKEGATISIAKTNRN